MTGIGRLASVMLAALAACCCNVSAASADVATTGRCSTDAPTLLQVGAGCTAEGDQNAGSYWRLVCNDASRACVRQVTCDAGEDAPGFVWVQVTDGVEGDTECRSSDDSLLRLVVTPGLVARAMERLSWPSSELVIQPPDGRTLVNFRTNFLTTNDEATTQSVTLLGQRVVIEARPSSYGWDFGDGTSSTTSTPGARYPDLDVTHRYLRKGAYAPSVSTTYVGRFRVNGGEWQEIPGSLTVPGEAVDLQVIGARPTLVGADD
jgi:hypothetical protein